MGAYEDAAEARMAAAKIKKANLDAAERARITALGKANAEAVPETRAQEVTAARLASSPLAQEAARTTAALKSFTAKGGLLGVPGSNIQTPTPTSTATATGLPAGFTKGPYPKELEQLFGPSSGYLGYKIETVTDKNGKTYNQLSVATSPNSSQTFGAAFTKDASGKYVSFTTSSPDNPAVVDTTSVDTTTTKPTDTGPTLASDVFKQTLAVFFGATEMAKPWANELYKAVSKFYKQGATSEEAFNMALLESETNPLMTDFTKRFKGIFALQKMKQAGKAVTVPTIAEYFATESKMGDILKASNLGDLANEDFLGDVLSKGISATQFGERIVNIFDRIDNAPAATKKTLQRFFPYLDRTQLAKTLALGEKGAKQLEQEIAGYEVLSAAEFQGLGLSKELPSGISVEQAADIAKGGGTYASTLGQFGQIAGARETEQKLAEISGMKSLGVTGLTSAVISKSAAELKKLEDLTRQEEARFSGKAGNIGSKTFASQSRANRLI